MSVLLSHIMPCKYFFYNLRIFFDHSEAFYHRSCFLELLTQSKNFPKLSLVSYSPSASVFTCIYLINFQCHGSMKIEK